MAPRLDQELVARGLVESRSQGQELIRDGSVFLNGAVAERAAIEVSAEDEINIQVSELRYVSRAGRKLAGALAHFEIKVGGKVALDVGSSTGGFVDCLLQSGAAFVYAVDVGTEQLAEKLRENPRLSLREKTDIRKLPDGWIQQQINLITVDVSFISLEKVLPSLSSIRAPGTELLALIKPQFEVGRANLGKGGIVRSETLRNEARDRVNAAAKIEGWSIMGNCAASLAGGEGNQEYFLYARYDAIT